MQAVVFDHQVNPDSAAIRQVFWDGQKEDLYLVFNNGKVVSRWAPAWNTELIDNITSWGKAWNSVLSKMEPGLTMLGDEPIEFVHREASASHSVEITNSVEITMQVTKENFDRALKSARTFAGFLKDQGVTDAVIIQGGRV